MKVYFDRKFLLGFFLALGILTALSIYSYKNSQDSINTSRMVSYTNAVLYCIEKLHSLKSEDGRGVNDGIQDLGRSKC